jgi:hypothetical protein
LLRRVKVFIPLKARSNLIQSNKTQTSQCCSRPARANHGPRDKMTNW